MSILEKHKATIVATTILITTMIATFQIQAYSQSFVEGTENSLLEALRTMDEAYYNGIDKVTSKPIIDKLNQALSLIDEAKQLASEGKASDTDILMSQAQALAEQAKTEADTALKLSKQRTFQSKLLAWGLVPAASIITTFSVIHGYKWHTEREQRKLLNMIIRRKPEKKD